MKKKVIAYLAIVIGLVGFATVTRKIKANASASPTITIIEDASEINKITVADNRVKIVKFFATWCPTCTAMETLYNELAAQFGQHADFFKVDIDKAKAVAVKYGVQGIPTFMVFYNGNQVDVIIDGTKIDRIVGKVKKSKIEQLIRKALEQYKPSKQQPTTQIFFEPLF